MLFALVLGSAHAACIEASDGFVSPSTPVATPPGDLFETQGPPRCDGVCVTTAPATYTGPSIFWLGPESEAPDCPIETPHGGIEGFIKTPMHALFARECLVTPSDLCVEEGETCAPAPREDHRLCVHHNGDTSCPEGYEHWKQVIQIEGNMLITLCCQELTRSG